MPNGNRMRANDPDQLHVRVAAMRVEKDTKDVILMVRPDGAGHWLANMLDAQYGDRWKPEPAPTPEIPATSADLPPTMKYRDRSLDQAEPMQYVRLSGEDATNFIRDHAQFQVRSHGIAG